jgi:arylsulfatase A-like enzyme
VGESATGAAAGSASNGAAEEAVFAEASIPATTVRAERERLTRMVRTRDWKYVLYPSGAEELYDTRADPHEVRNLAASPESAERLAALRERLRLWLDATGGR